MERIILGGISQGCATAILTLLSSGLDFGGFIGWCSWLPFQKEINCLTTGSPKTKEEVALHIRTILEMPICEHAEIENLGGPEESLKSLSVCPTSSSNKTPIFLAHSRDDETVPFTQGEGPKEAMKSLGYDVTWKEYDNGGHWIQPKHGVDDMVAFLQGVMGK